MDDFSTGPQSFDLLVSSLDPQVDTVTTSSIIKLNLAKPLALSSGTWEVCVKQLIFTPLFGNIQSTLKDRTIYYLDSEAETQPKSFRLTDPLEYPDSISKIVQFFNQELPKSLKSKLKAKVDAEKYIVFETQEIQFCVQSPYLAWLFGLNTDQYYPFILSKDKQDIRSTYRPYVRGICPYFKITTDFTAPEYFGTHYEQIILTDVLPKTTTLTSFNYDSPTYSTVINSYISSITLSILDTYNNPFILIDQRCPTVIRLHFRRKSQFIF